MFVTFQSCKLEYRCVITENESSIFVGLNLGQ